MRVNVTYSVDLSELAQLVQELLLKAEDNVEKISTLFPKIQECVEKEQEGKAVGLLEEIRSNISRLDHSLFDSYNILNGYQQATLQLRNAQKEQKNQEGGHAEGG